MMTVLINEGNFSDYRSIKVLNFQIEYFSVRESLSIFNYIYNIADKKSRRRRSRYEKVVDFS